MATEQPTEKKKQKRIREKHYEIADTQLLSRSRTLRQHLLDNLAPFTAFDADFNNTFTDNWLVSIEECESHPTDENLDDELRQYTTDMEAARSACFTAANDLEYYVKKAFPKNESMLREFGFNERKKVRTRTASTLLWLITMRFVAQDYYLADLTAAGMPLTVLTGLETAADELAEKEVFQELFKRSIIRHTRQRITKFNNLYKFFTTVHLAAQSVFTTDKERKELFNLNP